MGAEVGRWGAERGRRGRELQRIPERPPRLATTVRLLHDHLAMPDLRIVEHLLDGCDGPEADVLVGEQGDPLVHRLFLELGAHAPERLFPRVAAGELLRDQLRHPELVAQVPPEVRLESPDGDPAPVLGFVQRVAGMLARQHGGTPPLRRPCASWLKTLITCHDTAPSIIPMSTYCLARRPSRANNAARIPDAAVNAPPRCPRSAPRESPAGPHAHRSHRSRPRTRDSSRHAQRDRGRARPARTPRSSSRRSED